MLLRLITSMAVATAVSGAGLIGAYGASNETVLFKFTNDWAGLVPKSGVVFGPDGALYGTTSLGGDPSIEEGRTGVVFRLARQASGPPVWTETVLHRFTGTLDGKNPYGALAFDAAGAMYGATTRGGSLGHGTIFKITPVGTNGACWSYSVIDNSGSSGTLLVGRAGLSLYGISGETVFRLTPPARGHTAWTRTILHTFGVTKGDGSVVNSDLTMDGSGAILGTTTRGGRYNGGTVFRLTPSPTERSAWKVTVLFSFFAGSAGYGPAAGVAIGKGGAVYGTTYYGGVNSYGSLYKLAPPAAGKTAWTETVLHSFTGTDGGLPAGGLVIDAGGALYGTGGQNVFKLSPPAKGQSAWTETVVHQFNGTDGSGPRSDLIFDNAGALYGMTPRGGPRDSGVVFKVTP